MIKDDYIEKCKNCTLKHLSAALLLCDDTDYSPILRAAYFSGNLSHAENHIVKIDETLAANIRDIRLSTGVEALLENKEWDTQSTKTGLAQIIQAVYSFEPKNEPKKAINVPKIEQKSKKHCNCGHK